MGDVFFVLSKVFWALARPDTLLALLCLAGVLLRRRRAGRTLLGLTAGATLLIGFLPLHSVLLRPLEARFPIAPPLTEVQGIIQLGGAEDIVLARLTGQTQVNAAADRYIATLTLARAHPEARVLFAGGAAQLRPDGDEATWAQRLLIETGLDPGRLTLETRSRNTAENASNARALVPDTLTGSWVLVTSAFHMPRAVGSFCAAGWTGIVPWPVDHRAKPLKVRWDLAGNLSALGVAMREWIGLVAYYATGRSDRLFPNACP